MLYSYKNYSYVVRYISKMNRQIWKSSVQVLFRIVHFTISKKTLSNPYLVSRDFSNSWWLVSFCEPINIMWSGSFVSEIQIFHSIYVKLQNITLVLSCFHRVHTHFDNSDFRTFQKLPMSNSRTFSMNSQTFNAHRFTHISEEV